SPTPTWCGDGSSLATGPASPRPSTWRSRTCRPATSIPLSWWCKTARPAHRRSCSAPRKPRSAEPQALHQKNLIVAGIAVAAASGHIAKKNGPAMRPARERWGIEPYAELNCYAETTGPVRVEPRGAGGLRNPVLLRTGPEATADHPTRQLGGRRAEVWQHYDLINKSVRTLTSAQALAVAWLWRDHDRGRQREAPHD